MDNKTCPECGQKTLLYLESVNDDVSEEKTAWACDCTDMVVYIVKFK